MGRDIKFRVMNFEEGKFENPKDIIIGFDSSGIDVWRNDGTRLDYCELNEYTSLKDKNGKEIYEGDLIKNKHFGYMVCAFNDGSFMWCDKYIKIKFMRYESDVEVIGNIYENPEFLEGDKQ